MADDLAILRQILPGGQPTQRQTGWSALLPDGRRVLVSGGSVYGLASQAMTPEEAAELVRGVFDAWAEAVLGTDRDFARCLAVLPVGATITLADGTSWTRPETA